MVRALLYMTALSTVLLTLAMPPCVQANGDVEGEAYVVKAGDTLSSIAADRLGDINRWSEILAENPQITDPRQIYPGDSIHLPPPSAGATAVEGQEKAGDMGQEAISISSGSAVTESDRVIDDPPPVELAAPVETASQPEAAVAEPEMATEAVDSIPVINENFYRSTGYISKDLPSIAVVASVAEKINLGAGDEIFIDTVVDEGSLFTVVRKEEKVVHPESGAFLGWKIRILGWAEVNCPGESTSRAKLQMTVDTVEVGDFVVPFDPDDVLENNIVGPRQSKFCLSQESKGYIVATQEKKTIQGGGDIVFVDQGSDTGTKQGDMYVVYRNPTADSIQVIGQLQILRVGEETSAALVINSIEEIEVEDFIQPWEAPAEEASLGG